MWWFNPNTTSWTEMKPPSPKPDPANNGSEPMHAYDSVTDMVYDLEANTGSFWQYNPATDKWTDLKDLSSSTCNKLDANAVIDPVRRNYVCIGGGEFQKISLTSPFTVTSLNGAGCGTLASDNAPGFAFDPTRNVFVGWNGGNTVYTYNPDTDSCSSQSYTGGPGAQQADGTYGRFRYFPALGVFVVVNSVTENAYSLRVVAATGGTTTPGPQISGVGTSSITTGGGTVGWTTDVASTSQVEYGTTTSYGTSTTLNSTMVTAHSVVLSGLTAGTLYHYRVHSKDSSNNETISGDFAFATNSVADTTAPTVSISAPAAGSTVTGSVTVSASASDNVGVSSVQFTLDGSSLGSPVTTAPYSISWDTTTAANGAHTLSAQAKDAAGNTGTAVGVTVTVSNTASTTGQDFTTRCAAAGVLVCQGFDTAATFALTDANGGPGWHLETDCPTWPTPCVQRDTTVAFSGASSARLDIYGNTGENAEANWVQPFGQTFGPNTTFYVQYAFRADPNWTSIDWTQTGPAGDNTAPKLSIFHNHNSTCASEEITFHDHNAWDMLAGYSECGSTHFTTQLDGVTYTENTPFLLQQGFTAPAPFTGENCQWSNAGPTGTCFKFVANTWYTLYFKIHIGGWGQPNSTIEAWFAPQGSGMKKFINVTGFPFDQDTGSDGFDTLTLTQFMTGKMASVAHATAHVWYDELIVSSNPIAPPTGPQP